MIVALQQVSKEGKAVSLKSLIASAVYIGQSLYAGSFWLPIDHWVVIVSDLKDRTYCILADLLVDFVIKAV